MPKQTLQEYLKFRDNPVGQFKTVSELKHQLHFLISQFNALKSEIASQINELEKRLNPTPTQQELLALIQPLIPRVKDGHTPTNEELIELMRPLVKDGHTPTNEELVALMEPLIPHVEDGKTPVKGVDYFTENDMAEIAGKVLKEIPPPKEIKPEEVKAKLKELPIAEAWFPAEHISGLMNFIRNLMPKRVQLGGGGGITQLTATGTIDGVNATFTFTKKPTYIVSDGVEYRENKGWTYSGSTATMSVPPEYDIYGKI